MDILPMTPDRWHDMETLFGPRGACAGCWCMWWRLGSAEFERGKGAKNRDAMRKIVASGGEPGLIAYVDGQPAGWCAVAPREAYTRLAKSRTLKPIDDRPVWSVSCFFVARPYRRRGVTVALLKAAAAFARARGATVLEGYPVRARGGRMPDTFAWTGLPGSFLKAGFTEVAAPSASRSIVRLELGPAKRAAAKRGAAKSGDAKRATKASTARTARAKER
jgi:GNAT superfamily N-acetyltransferase